MRKDDAVTLSKRPRNVDVKRAAAIFYGDIGTSKAYVIGLAFAIAGYSSFWLIAAVCLLLILVAINYIIICRCYPEGGGAYSSVRRRSQVLSLIAAFFLIADLAVTAALSAQSAFSYFQVESPVIWTGCMIGLIGAFNFFGPHKTGKQAYYIFAFTFACLCVLALFSLPHLGEAVKQLKPLSGGILENWINFVSVIVALSGIEVIANMTGIMKLDPGSSVEKPSVTKTAKKALIWVSTEVVLFTAFFSLASMALKGLTLTGGEVYSPDNVPIRDAWFKYLSETFVGQALGTNGGIIFGWIISIALGILLFSAVNTAITGLISLFYVMSNDGELPRGFQKLNKFGVPTLPLILATMAPIVIILFIHDIAGLAHLYAIGFVGAIATNLVATASDRRLPVKSHERLLMFFTFAILFLVEITLFIVKPQARNYILIIVAVGLLLRALAKEMREKQKIIEPPPLPPSSKEKFAILCAVKKEGNALEYALQRAHEKKGSLYVLYVHEQHIIFETDINKKWHVDKEAKMLFEILQEKTAFKNVFFYYDVSDYLPDTVSEYAKTFEANEVVVEMSSHHRMINLFQGNQFIEIRNQLPNNIELLIIPDRP